MTLRFNFEGRKLNWEEHKVAIFFKMSLLNFDTLTSTESSEQINKRWKLIERKYALRSATEKQLNVPKKPKLKCLGFTYNGAKLFNMLPIEMKKVEDPSAFKNMTKKWIWENIPSY